MAVTVTAALVTLSVPDQTRPDGHAGWNNSKGDPAWIPDIDWNRRVQLTCTGSSGEVGTIVNWEVYDATTVPFKTSAEITATTAGTTASPFGPFVNNSTTWTVWATTGSSTAAAAKYADTGSPCVSALRANGPRVQVLLGDAGKPGRQWVAAAFLPGSGKKPTATGTVSTANPYTPTLLPSIPDKPSVDPGPDPGDTKPSNPNKPNMLPELDSDKPVVATETEPVPQHTRKTRSHKTKP